MWSTPSSPEQARYFSKHAPKRRVFGIMQIAFQVMHAFLAFAAWQAIFAWAFEAVPQWQWLTGPLAIVALAAMHMLFGVTWSTYWYDKLDDDPNTDSGIALPALIIITLFLTEVYGASQFLKGMVKPPETIEVANVDTGYKESTTGLEREYSARKAEIVAIFAERSAATALPYDNKIAALQRRRADSEATRKSIAGQVATIKRQRAEALEPIAAERSTALANALAQYNTRSQRAYDITEAQRTEVIGRNTEEQQRYEAEHGRAGSLAWLISAIMLGIIAALGYVRVRINVMSGILPQRNFTVLDAHGSLLERLGTAFGDAFNRRSLQFAVWFHGALSPKEAITTFDGTVVAKPGQYNTPAGVITERNTPAPPSKAQLYGEAYSKVSEKVASIKEYAPGYTPPRAVLDREMQKALTMNGTYASAEWEDPDLGLGKS